MLGRKDYTQKELDDATRAVRERIDGYDGLVAAVRASGDAGAQAALEAFEPALLNSLVLDLDRRFVHRVRMVSGTDGNPLNEVELLVESLMNNDGVLRGNTVVKYGPEESVTQLKPGDRVVLTRAQFERLAKAFLAEIEARFR